jgi:hypothetical protein
LFQWLNLGRPAGSQTRFNRIKISSGLSPEKFVHRKIKKPHPDHPDGAPLPLRHAAMASPESHIVLLNAKSPAEDASPMGSIAVMPGHFIVPVAFAFHSLQITCQKYGNYSSHCFYCLFYQKEFSEAGRMAIFCAEK